MDALRHGTWSRVSFYHTCCILGGHFYALPLNSTTSSAAVLVKSISCLDKSCHSYREEEGDSRVRVGGSMSSLGRVNDTNRGRVAGGHGTVLFPFFWVGESHSIAPRGVQAAVPTTPAASGSAKELMQCVHLLGGGKKKLQDDSRLLHSTAHASTPL
jgi:hypothetical protein